MVLAGTRMGGPPGHGHAGCGALEADALAHQTRVRWG